MAQQSKREYLESICLRYRQSGWVEKQRMLDEFMRVCGYHRKYAIGLLNRSLPAPRRAICVWCAGRRRCLSGFPGCTDGCP